MKVSLIVTLLVAGTINCVSYSAAAAAAAGVKTTREQGAYIVENHTKKPVVIIRGYTHSDGSFGRLRPVSELAAGGMAQTIGSKEGKKLARLWLFSKDIHTKIMATPIAKKSLTGNGTELSKLYPPSFDFSAFTPNTSVIRQLLEEGQAKLVVNVGPILQIYLTDIGKTKIRDTKVQKLLRELGFQDVPLPTAPIDIITDTTLATPARVIPLPAPGVIVIDTTLAAPIAPAT